MSYQAEGGGLYHVVDCIEAKQTCTGEATEEEKTLCRTMMKYWANFARNGDPNGDGLSKWSVFDINEQYLEISLKQKMGKQLKAHRIQFWSKAFPERIHAVIEEKKEHTEL